MNWEQGIGGREEDRRGTGKLAVKIQQRRKEGEAWQGIRRLWSNASALFV